MAAQRDGKIVVAGYADVGGVDQFALVRYNSDGSLDTSLNSNGKVTTAVGTGTCKGEGVALQEDGKIVVVGYSFNAGGQSCFTVLRYGTDGSLDTSFGDSGKVTTSCRKGRQCRQRGDAERWKDRRGRQLVHRRRQQ